MNDELSYDRFLQNIAIGANNKASTAVQQNCPVSYALNTLQGKWTNHVLFEMCAHEKVRFGELKKALPKITNTVLANTLRELEASGLVNREQFNEIPPRVEYSLSEKGKDLLPIYYEMFRWGMKYR